MRRPSPFRDHPGWSSRSTRRDSARGASGPRVELQLTPLIDCVFLLMIYFLWSANFAVGEQTLPSELSAAGGSAPSASSVPPPEADFDDLVVRVLWTESGPAWQVNDAPILSLGELRTMLVAIAGVKRDAPVILHPDPDVPLGDVIDVLDLSRIAGFEKVQVAAAE